MIQPNELRIGNWVSFKGLWNGTISKISEGSVCLNESDGIFDPESLRGIYVTKELLYKIGANDFPDGESLQLENRLISYAECRNEYYDNVTSVPLKYLHELQNLYFVLIGKELTITL